MRLSDEQIKACILHADNIVRKYAIDYFARGMRSDASVMETVIATFEKHGFEKASYCSYPLDDLTQSAATLDWCIGQLQRIEFATLEPGSPLEVYFWSLSDAVAAAEIGLLRGARERIDSMPADGCKPLQDAVGDRLRLADLDTDALWKELEAFCEQWTEEDDIDDIDTDAADRIADAIGRRPEAAERVLENLQGKVDYSEPNPLLWMDGFCIRIAGEMRLAPAIGPIVDRLDLEDEWISEQICFALVRIGTDEVVQACEDYIIGNRFRFGDVPSATDILCDIPTDAALAAVRRLLPKTKDQMHREQLVLAALLKFSDEAVKDARKFLRRLKGEAEAYNLEEATAAIAECLGIDFPEKAAWLAQARADELEEAERGLDDDEDEWEFDESESEFEDWDDDEELDEDDDPLPKVSYSPSLADAVDLPTPSIRNIEPKVGRNEPCPCGSGKKFKNCCLGKQARN